MTTLLRRASKGARLVSILGNFCGHVGLAGPGRLLLTLLAAIANFERVFCHPSGRPIVGMIDLVAAAANFAALPIPSPRTVHGQNNVQRRIGLAVRSCSATVEDLLKPLLETSVSDREGRLEGRGCGYEPDGSQTRQSTLRSKRWSRI